MENIPDDILMSEILPNMEFIKIIELRNTFPFFKNLVDKYLLNLIEKTGIRAKTISEFLKKLRIRNDYYTFYEFMDHLSESIFSDLAITLQKPRISPPLAKLVFFQLSQMDVYNQLLQDLTKLTFNFKQQMIMNPQKYLDLIESGDVSSMFPAFKQAMMDILVGYLGRSNYTNKISDIERILTDNFNTNFLAYILNTLLPYSQK